MYFPIQAPDGMPVYPKNPDGTDSRWRWGQEKVEKDRDRLEWIRSKNGWRLYFRIYHDDSIGKPPETIWTHPEAGSNRTSKKEIKALFRSEVFDTPKPELLLKRVIELSSTEGDYVLDSFAGSGTTAAVAHKMGRRWIGVELGDHCYTHCAPRMRQVCDGTDQGGVSKAVNWKGGGGFRFYELAPSLLKKDRHDNWVIDERYNPNLLAAAMAKHEGFGYNPGPGPYWKQGQSTEKDFIFTTTVMVTTAMLDRIHDDMKEDEGLLICARSFQEACENRYPNINIKKIPNMLLGRCEFGREDYSMNIIDMPSGDQPAFVPAGPKEDENAQRAKTKNSAQTRLF
jgi:adenine-specific DNA-methyltransferase